MKEKPILFSTPMVEALLAGRKTKTRRASNLGKVNESPDVWRYMGELSIPGEEHSGIHGFETYDNYILDIECPYGKVGDVLWVRETWFPTRFDYKKLLSLGDKSHIKYKAGGNYCPKRDCVGRSWKPSIHMPKEAARIFLEITDIRVERLQDISEEDAKAEGVLYYGEDSGDYKNYLYNDKHGDDWGVLTAIESFQTLWQSINGIESWDLNPWVWVIEFMKIPKP